eukprot:2484799-Amphidinium_carterae.2
MFGLGSGVVSSLAEFEPGTGSFLGEGRNASCVSWGHGVSRPRKARCDLPPSSGRGDSSQRKGCEREPAGIGRGGLVSQQAHQCDTPQ